MNEDQHETTQSVASSQIASGKMEVREWMLEVVAGADKGKKVTTLDSLLRVGSDTSNDLVLSDATVSRRHLEIERTRRGLLLRDLGSRNGSWVDGRRVIQAYLEPGDKVTLGQTRLVAKQAATPTEVELAGAESFGELVGSTVAMRAVFAELRRVSLRDVNLLIEGETGTGKELAARAVHSHSARRSGPFRVVDCNLITEEMAERELFGHSGGSDPSEEPSPGVFEAAAGGTVFLDEVGELPLSLQPKLLRVLETREVRAHEGRMREVDVRIVASTSRNLEEEVRLKQFRPDLYFRLAVARVRLPPLRTRAQDIPVLAQQILRGLGTPFELTPQTLSLLERYDWPGNVRELRNVIERGALMQETGNTNWLDFAQAAPHDDRPSRSVVDLVVGMPYHQAKDRVLADFERFYFAEIMKGSGFDMEVAERKTGLSMQSLYRLLKKNGLRLKDLKNAERLDR
ncbi:MAG TPA: sigma 54-interacting transcriptional regulator [Myxococcaceae bacterium]|nr:sigma 54-interacting transcriptional regulator [Myxococcaceae bacterium]